MGYRVDRTATLVLTDMDGAEVTVTIGVPIRALREWFEDTSLEARLAVFLRWARPTWNLEDEQGPIPVEAEAIIGRIPVPVIKAMALGWKDAVVEPPAPLPPTPSGGEP